MDGAGRVWRKASDHPDGVSGNFSGQLTVFDKAGQTQDASNVAKINGSWTPVGESFLWTNLTRDELSRLKIVTHPDLNTKHYDYTGCGCGGNSETRITDELGHYTITKTDFLGRLMEASEPLYSNPALAYSKAVYVYNELDQLTQIQHSNSSGNTQYRYFSYDGYSRLQSEATPEGGTVNYTYTANDLAATTNNQRNITVTSSYNTRNLPTAVSFSDGTPSASYVYDEYGARTQMNDGEGATNYSYNSYRQLQSETRTFAGLINKSFTLNYTYNQADQLTQANYVAANTGGGFGPSSVYYIKGTVTNSQGQPIAGVTVTLTGGSVGTQTTDSGGNYTFSNLASGRTYYVTPSLSGYAFTPSMRTYFNLNQNQNFADFTGAPAVYLISGFVLDGQSQPLQATVRLTGSQTANTTSSSSNGYYAFGNLAGGGNYTVSPRKLGYSFSPPSRTFNNLPGDQYNADFTGVTQTYTISGYIRNGQGQGIDQVKVNLYGDQTASTTSNSSGFYFFSNVPAGGDYTVIPSKANVTFTPLSRSYSDLQSNLSNVDFTGTSQAQTYFNKNVNYAYNSVGALNGVGTNLIGTDPNATTNVLNSLTFRGSGQLLSLNYGNGRRLTMGYDANRNQPTSMKVDRTNGTDSIIHNTYSYYTGSGLNDGRIRQITDNLDAAYTTTYNYDDYNRLSSASSGAYNGFYQYDPWGNIKTLDQTTINYAQTGGAPSTNRILNTVTGGVTSNHAYDNAGNMTSDGAQNLTFDGANRLLTASGGGSNYGYSGNGQRVRVTENGAAVYYVYSSVLGQAVMEANSGGIRRAYVYAGNKLVAQQSLDSEFYWMHTNHLGNSQAMTDINGNLIYKGQFAPYGQPLSEWSSQWRNTKKFTGYERDAATGLDYANARMYSSGRGRFLQADPGWSKALNPRHPESLNRYTYVQNDPANAIDPTGQNLALGFCYYTSDWYHVGPEWGGWWQRDFSCVVYGGGGGGAAAAAK